MSLSRSHGIALRVAAVGAFTILLGSAYTKLSQPTIMLEAAQAYLATLTDDQRAKGTFKMDDDERFYWHFVPDANVLQTWKRGRKGLTFLEMTAPQRHLANALLSSALSQRGFIKASSIMSLEEVLRIMEKDDGTRRNPDRYYFSVFGTPSEKGVWGLRVEGHHISLHFTVVDGKVVSSPMFFGSNPAEVKEGPRKGLRVLGQEEDLGRELLNALSADQKKTAIVAEEAYKDIITGASRKAALEGQPSGLSATKMNAKQKQLLELLIEEYCYNLPEEAAQLRLEKVKKAGSNIYFAWAGASEKGGPHYYRVQGPTFLIEYDNTQNNANHIHSVWRDYTNDWGEDLLKEHYQTSHK